MQSNHKQLFCGEWAIYWQEPQKYSNTRTPELKQK